MAHTPKGWMPVPEGKTLLCLTKNNGPSDFVLATWWEGHTEAGRACTRCLYALVDAEGNWKSK